VTVLTITSNLRLTDIPINIRVGPRDSGLSKPSVINVSQIFAVDKALLSERVGRLPDSLMRAVDDSQRVLLSLI
jgi:mRNA interferase MazF